MRESRWLPSLLEVFRVKRLWRPFFVSVGGYGILPGVHLSQVHQPKLGWCNRGTHLSPLGFAACQSKKCTNRSLVGAAETAAPPDPGKSRVSPGNYIAKINGVHREVMCWHLLSTTHAGCNTRELIPLWYLLGRLPLASRLAVAHGEVHR